MDGDNKQDAAATASMIDALLDLISQDSRFQMVSEVIIQSDNAKCYQSNDFRVLIMLINSKSRVKVRRHVFTETQDGKSSLDAHFGNARSHLEKFMVTSQRNRVRSIATPNGLAYALAWEGGISNSCVQLLVLDRDKLVRLEGAMKKMAKNMGKFFKRVNDFFFDSDLPFPVVKEDDLARMLLEKPMVTISVQEYSGIENKVTFSCQPDKVELTKKDAVQGNDTDEVNIGGEDDDDETHDVPCAEENNASDNTNETEEEDM